MPQLLTKSSTILCPHGGQVTVITSNSKSKAGGDFLARKTDTFTISGCSFMIGSNPHPCMTVEWSSEASRSKSTSGAHLHTGSVGMCKAADGAVQGVAQIANTQAKVQGI